MPRLQDIFASSKIKLTMRIATISKYLIVFAICIAFASCAQPITWSTPSGKPEVLVKGIDVQGKVVGRMIAKQWGIVNQSSNAMSFERQQLSDANRAVFALGGDTMGIIEGWNLAFIPNGDGSRVCLVSTYVKTKDYGTSVNSPDQKAGQEFMSILSKL